MRKYAGLAFLALSVFAQTQDDWRPWMDRGVQAYKSGRYREAADAFQNAVYRNPSDPNAHLYLASACMAAWRPGAASPDNTAWADKAEREFGTVLALDSENESALASLGSLTLQQKRFEDAAAWYQRLLHRNSQVSPTSRAATRDAHYALGMIGWTRWYPDYAAARKRLGMRPQDPGPLPDPRLRRELRDKWSPAIQEAMDHLRSAWYLGNADALGYLSRLIREKADLRDTETEYRRDLREAGDWARQANEAAKPPQ